MNLLKAFQNHIRENGLFAGNEKLLLGVSGGIDSVVLCELSHQSGFDFVIAHCNFQLRGEESERDELFVRNLAQQYGREILARKFDTAEYARENKVSVQVAARELRYSWFHELTEKDTHQHASLTPEYIVTAHHADDNVETILMNFFKGTGIAGLRGILPKQGRIVRPLLSFSKSELIQFAKEKQLSWVEDSSNETDYYTRNYFRHQVIPLIEKLYPAATENLMDNAARFREIEVLYHQAVGQHKKNLVEKKANEAHIPVLKLKKSSPLKTLIYEIIRDYNFTSSQVRDVIQLLESESGKFIQSPTHRIIKNRQWLIIAPLNTEEADNIIIGKTDTKIQFAGGLLHFAIINKATGWNISAENSVACLDARLINYPLLLRKWKQGDYFYPLGMKKKKKLSRFFIDQKLSKTEKENIWVLEMNKRIVWVIKYRIDDRFKITEQTKEILQVTNR